MERRHSWHHSPQPAPALGPQQRRLPPDGGPRPRGGSATGNGARAGQGTYKGLASMEGMARHTQQHTGRSAPTTHPPCPSPRPTRHTPAGVLAMWARWRARRLGGRQRPGLRHLGPQGGGSTSEGQAHRGWDGPARGTWQMRPRVGAAPSALLHPNAQNEAPTCWPGSGGGPAGGAGT